MVFESYHWNLKVKPLAYLWNVIFKDQQSCFSDRNKMDHEFFLTYRRMKELGVNSDLNVIEEIDLYRQYNNAIRVQFDFWMIYKTIQYTAGHKSLSFSVLLNRNL